jgi:GntR family transcriptional regulator
VAATVRIGRETRDAAPRRRTAPAAPAGVDPALPTPLYHQIYVLLREQILSGVYGAEARVPTEQALSLRFGVSRITAKRALDELAADGLVVRRRGRGTSVASVLPTRPFNANLSGLLENLLMLGLKTSVEILEFGYQAAPEDVRAALGLPPGAQVQRAVRVRSLDGAPLSYTTSFVPADLGRAYDRSDLATKPLLALLERAGCLIGGAEQTIGAALADTVVAPRLGVRVGSPLLTITRTVADQTGRPVEHIHILYRPDRYQYRMKLTRVQGDATKLWSPAE